MLQCASKVWSCYCGSPAWPPPSTQAVPTWSTIFGPNFSHDSLWDNEFELSQTGLLADIRGPRTLGAKYLSFWEGTIVHRGTVYFSCWEIFWVFTRSFQDMASNNFLTSLKSDYFWVSVYLHQIEKWMNLLNSVYSIAISLIHFIMIFFNSCLSDLHLKFLNIFHFIFLYLGGLGGLA